MGRRSHTSSSGLDLARVPPAAELTVPWGRQECRQEHQPGSGRENLGVGWGDTEDLKFGACFYFKGEQKSIWGRGGVLISIKELLSSEYS